MFTVESLDKVRTSNDVVELNYIKPYDWGQVLLYLQGRAIKGVEVVKNNEYRRTVQIHSNEEIYTGWFVVSHKPIDNAICVAVSESLKPVMQRVISRIRFLFDIDIDPNKVYEALNVMNDIRPGLCVNGTRVPRCFDEFEMSVRAIIGQQVSVKAANTFTNRIVEKYGTPVQTGREGLTHVFPNAKAFVFMGERIFDNLGILGITSARSGTIYRLAEAVIKEEIDFNSPHPQEEINKLASIKGIGQWTANYIAMRAMGWNDAFLESDAGVKNALPGYSSKELLVLSANWRPMRSYAVVNIWNTLYKEDVK